MRSSHKRALLGLLVVLLALLGTHPAQAQYAATNGYSVPVSGTIRVLLVFARVDYTGSCSTPPPYLGWNPPSAVPSNAYDWFDPTSGIPSAYITSYYWQSSFGSYRVLGDYLNQVITVPCNGRSADGSGTSAVISQLATLFTNGATTAGGFPLSSFDFWTIGAPGLPMPNTSNGKLDALVIVWANNDFFGCGGCGYGVQDLGYRNTPFAGMSGIENVGSFNVGSSGESGWNFFIAEYFHAMFGPNNWHTSNGAGDHTFLESPASFSTTAQSGSSGFVACGYDRYRMRWRQAGRLYDIGAVAVGSLADVASDIDITTHPNGVDLRLRDYWATGDELRIRLPHVDNVVGGKRQYLWLENHRLHLSAQQGKMRNYDVIGSPPAGYYMPGYISCEPPSSPGTYAYIQVGKDVDAATTAGELFGLGSYAQPNALGSWLYPLPADGRFDREVAARVPANVNLCGNWGNANYPLVRWGPDMQSNPLAGHSDLAQIGDLDGNGQLFTPGDYYPGFSQLDDNGLVVHDLHGHGDSGDSYGPATGKTILSLATNPAPLPVLTHRRGATTTASYENRKIYLSGLSVKVLSEAPDGTQTVRVRWDDWTLDKSVRWCGDIDLRNDPDDPFGRVSQLVVSSGHQIELDQGLSVTRVRTLALDDGSSVMADPTRLTLEPGTILRLQDGAGLVVRKGCTLDVKPGATLRLQGKSSVHVEPGAYLCIEPGAIVDLTGVESRLYVNQGALPGSHPEFPVVACQGLCSIVTTGTGLATCAPSCVSPPLGMTAWWTFDGEDVEATLDLVGGLAFTPNGGPGFATSAVQRGLRLDGLGQFATISDDPAVSFGTGDFTVACWIRSVDTRGVRVILDKRIEAGSTRGYSLYTTGGQLGFQLSAGPGSSVCQPDGSTSCTNYDTGLFVADGVWHHVLVSIERASTTGLRAYVDGTLGYTGNAAVRANLDLDVDRPLVVGRRSDNATGYWAGVIDELMFFNRALTATEAKDLGRSDRFGLCKGTMYVPASSSYCYEATGVLVPLLFCNPTAAEQTFTVTGGNAGAGSMATGTTCTEVVLPMPSGSAPLQVTVPAFQCRKRTVLVRPSPGTVAVPSCFVVRGTNLATGLVITGHGTVTHNSNSCWTAYHDPNWPLGAFRAQEAHERTQVVYRWPAPKTPLEEFEYRFVLESVDDGESATAPPAHFAGLGVGEALTGRHTVGDGVDSLGVQIVAVGERIPVCALRAEMRAPGGGEWQPVDTQLLGVSDETDEAQHAPQGPGSAAGPVVLSIRPNPFRETCEFSSSMEAPGAEPVSIVDVAGRLIRQLEWSAPQNGYRRTSWDGRDSHGEAVAPGMYFARMRTAQGWITRSVVHVN